MWPLGQKELFPMSRNSKQTSSQVASNAGAALRNPSTSATQRSLAASALSQSGTNRQTGAAMEEKAGRVLQSDKYSDTTRQFAASVVSQANKTR